MNTILLRGRWSITFGGQADPVWQLRLVRYRLQGHPTPTGPAYRSLMDLVRGEMPTADAILVNLLEQAEKYAGSAEYLWLTQPPIKAARRALAFHFVAQAEQPERAEQLTLPLLATA